MKSGKARAVEYVKTQAYGNDFILVAKAEWARHLDRFGEAEPERVRAWCDRRLGVGADGLIVFSSSEPVSMSLFNSDGGRAQISGNGVRCLAAYQRYLGGVKTKQDQMEIETDAGLIRLELVPNDPSPTALGRSVAPGAEFRFRADMGKPRLASVDIPMRCTPEKNLVLEEPLDIGGEILEVTALSMGNPHCVLFCSGDSEESGSSGGSTAAIDDERFYELGPRIERHPRFPEGTNVEFVRVMPTTSNNQETIQMRIWERGAGETQSSGTGSAASAVAAMLRGLAKETLRVQTPGGTMQVDWPEKERVFVTGSATVVATGQYLD